MGITEYIRDALSSKILIHQNDELVGSIAQVTCAICNNKSMIDRSLCLYAKDEGPVCFLCGERFAPDVQRKVNDIREKRNLSGVANPNVPVSVLSPLEWETVGKNLEALSAISEDLVRGIARGIVEAPSGHIGLLYLAKDIYKPERKVDESEKDYELRVKSFRIQKLQEKLRAETCDRITLLRRYFELLGLPDSIQ